MRGGPARGSRRGTSGKLTPLNPILGGPTINSLKALSNRHPILARWLLWVLAVACTLAAFTWQDKTGPTYPLDGIFETDAGPVHFIIVRSGIINDPLPVVLLDPVPPGVTGVVEYRRFKSNDPWSRVQMHAGEFEFERRGRMSKISGTGTGLPGLPERAGKYEIFLRIDDGDGDPVSVTGDRPIQARFKGGVPTPVLIAHIFVIFASMTLAIRTVLEALADGSFKWMLRATIVSFLLGAFLLGPLVQWHAFGVWWSGIPFGYDWTDNKVLLSLAAWGFALYSNRGSRRSRGSVYAAGIVTLLVYFIPHSIFGSEFDYTTGKGHGTAG